MAISQTTLFCHRTYGPRPKCQADPQWINPVHMVRYDDKTLLARDVFQTSRLKACKQTKERTQYHTGQEIEQTQVRSSGKFKTNISNHYRDRRFFVDVLGRASIKCSALTELSRSTQHSRLPSREIHGVSRQAAPDPSRTSRVLKYYRH